MSKVSIASDMFDTGEDAETRLRKDEAAWRGELGRDSIRSLSGIYGDGDISIRTQGEKLSISSFLRSGSGPLGCLEKAEDAQRPTFGLPVVSPQKKPKARPILPPPEDKLTFCVDQVPTKDTTVEVEKDPWNVESLVEQFSMVHGDRESDVSVPSLSCIGELLSEMKEGLTPKDIMDRLMNASKKVSSKARNNKSQLLTSSVINLDSTSLSHCGDHQKLKTIPSFVDGEKSFCRGYESDRSTRYSSSFCSRLSLDEGPPAMALRNGPVPNVETITINDSVDPSVCNITDFGGEEEEAYVCVLTPESMDFDIFNDFNREQHYTINKACYVDGQRRDAAALIHIPVSRMTLQPGEKRVVSVTVAALIGETIKIKVEVTRFDPVTQEREVNNVFGKIVAEIPKISLLHPLSVDMKPVADERLKYQGMMVLRNNGRSVVPVKLSLVQLSHLEVDMFFLDREKTTSVTYRLEPGQTLKQVINCLTPPIFECSRTTGQTLVNAQVQVTLATSAQVQLPPITATTFTARLSPNFFCVPASLTMTADSPLPCQVYNSGTQVYSFQATATSGFTVQPCIFTAQPQQTVTLVITFLGRTFKKGILTLNASELQSKSSGKFYTIQLQGTGSCSTSSSVSGTPQNSRPTSPISPCNSIAEGGLQLACTHKQLVWGGCHLQQRVVKSCSLKNLNSQREKLRLSLSDPHNCFKILTEKKTVECEMLVSLQPMENCQVSVVMLAANPGPKWGHLTISRFNQPQDKKVLLLYGFGGKAHVNIEGVMTDPEQHMWLYLDPPC
ncbi:uncharacterized protein LOC124372671, partial [Homalodisca vitripennis]|uniref:uncharacterized protein LOC124372671 n=1 Tax=Homalodisca vitripennis TaxID=197043 RepID=UPI001EEA0BD4